MKKIFLTFALVGFGAAGAFAQTTDEVQVNEQQQELPIEKLSNPAEMEAKKEIAMSELPQAVQDAFQNSEFKDWEVAAIYEVEAPQEENIQLSNTPEEAGLQEEVTYEIKLISKEVEEAEEVAAEEEETATEETTELTTETVKTEAPALLLQYDKEGKLLKQEEEKSENKLEELEKNEQN